MRMLAMSFSNGRQNPNNVYWGHIFCQNPNNVYWGHILCQNPNNVYWEHSKFMVLVNILWPSTARNWWQDWLEFCWPVKLFVRKASLLAYVSFCQQSIAEKNRTLFVCLAQWSLFPGRPLITVLSQEKERKGLEKVSQYADKSSL